MLTGFSSFNQIGAIVLGGVAGLFLCRTGETRSVGTLSVGISRPMGFSFLALFALLLVVPPLLARAWPAPELALFNGFYRSGALVFGGGHVVLPLLRGAVVDPGWVTDDAFLAGYGAAQAVPGPLFSFAAYLGAVASHAPGLIGGCVALFAIFLPGVLVLAGTLPFWDLFRRREWAQATMRGINAAVVGLLAAALFDPVWTTAVRSHADFAIALGCFILLISWRAPPLVVVIVGALFGLVLGIAGRR